MDLRSISSYSEKWTDFWIDKLKHGGVAVGLNISQLGCEISLWITSPIMDLGLTMDTAQTRRKTFLFPLMDHYYSNGLLIFLQTSIKIPMGFVQDNSHIVREESDYCHSQRLEHWYRVLGCLELL